MTAFPLPLPDSRQRVARAALVTGLVTAAWDFLCASALGVFAYHSTFSRFWQGVAAAALGPRALEMGARGVAVGLMLHLLVAFVWSTLFVLALARSERLRRVVDRPLRRVCRGVYLRPGDLARDVACGHSLGDGQTTDIRVSLVGADLRARAVRDAASGLYRAAGTRSGRNERGASDVNGNLWLAVPRGFGSRRFDALRTSAARWYLL